MRQENVYRLLQRRPCPLLRLHLTNGLVFEINDPDAAGLGRSVVELLFPSEQMREREAAINLLHVIWIEVLPPAS
jgi:hypothetical protein